MKQMNLIDYVKEIGNNDFKAKKFHEVDALILSIIPYIPFKNLVPAFKKEAIKLQDLTKKLDKDLMRAKGIFIGNTFKLLEVIANTKRYANIALYNYMYIINEEMQFGALTMKLPDKSTFIAFAGTDSSIIGWEEDFKMAYMYPGKSQKYANVYLNNTIKLLDRNIRIGGHSKGGNLAISSAMNSKFYIKPRIKEIFNFDGPGFLKEQIDSKEYKSIASKIKMYIPEQSIIGMILYHTPDYKVVKAKHFSILQHDVFNWKLDNNGFILSKQNKRSKKLEQRLTKKLEDMSIPERLELVENIFNLFKKNNIKDTKEIKLNNIFKLIKSFNDLDKDTKNQLIEFLIILFIK